MLGLASMLSTTSLLAASDESIGPLDPLGPLDPIDPIDPMAPRSPHFAARAKAVIWLFINGGPSQVDTWDHKPALARHDGQELEGFDAETGFFVEQVGPIMRSPFRFERRGESGTWVPEIFPHMGRHVDDMAFVHSLWTQTNNHSPALFQINTGMSRMGFPCVGSWVNYGLGSPNRSLPGFVVMYDTKGRGKPKGYSQNWSAGFLPGVFQGTALRHQGDPIANLRRRSGLTDRGQRRQLALLERLNRAHLARHGTNQELEARIESFELAYRMQTCAPEALDVDAEPAAVRELYGLDDPHCGHFARQCLTARRLVERGVRFVQIYSGGEENEKSWDGHTNIEQNHRGFALETDQPIGALLTDLKRSGLLDEVLVIWGGEFGRLPLMQRTQGGAQTGRDHNPHAFTYWFAGAGVKGGHHHGETDELGHRAVVDRVSVNDLHATILHLLGMDHERLTYRYNGRDFRLTDVAGRVVRGILA